MRITLRSFAKINLGLRIGPVRTDGFHELRTIYQTIALHDLVTVELQPGSGIEIRCADPRVPLDECNTCYKVAERVLKAIPQGLKPGSSLIGDGTAKAVPFQTQNHKAARGGKVVITIEKRLPLQGGMGAASSNGVATMLGLERVLGAQLSANERQRIAAEVGSDLPLFLVGGTVFGVGRGEEVHALPDLPTMHLVVVTPAIGVSTPRAFERWDEYVANVGAFDSASRTESAASDRARSRFVKGSDPGAPRSTVLGNAALTQSDVAGTMNEFSRSVLERLSESSFLQAGPASGVPAGGGDRAETPLLDLVRAGIENDFERVVFPEYPDLREVKSVLESQGAQYASLSGSGSTLYGVFGSAEEAEAVAARMRAAGHVAVATQSLRREEYWEQLAISN